MYPKLLTAVISVSLLVAVALVTRAQVALAQATPSHNVFSDSFVTTIFNPCNGESALVAAKLFFVTEVTIDSSDGSHSMLHTHIVGQGMGNLGNKYVFIDNLGVFSLQTPSSGESDQTVTIAFIVIGEGSAPDFKIHITIHVTVDPAGKITSQVLNVEGAECP